MARFETVVTVGLAGVAVLTAGALMGVAVQQRGLVAEVARAGQLVAHAEGLEVDLLAYNRMSNMLVLRGEGDPAISRGYVEASLKRRLQAARALAADRAAAPLLAAAEQRIAAFLAARHEAEAGAGPESLAAIDRKISPALDAAFAALEALARQELDRAARGVAQARRWGAAAVAAGWAILAVVVLGFGGATLWVRRRRAPAPPEGEPS